MQLDSSGTHLLASETHLEQGLCRISGFYQTLLSLWRHRLDVKSVPHAMQDSRIRVESMMFSMVCSLPYARLTLLHNDQ